MPENTPYTGPERRANFHCADHCHVLEHSEAIQEALSGLSGGMQAIKWIAGAGIPVIVGLCAWILTTLYESNGEFRELKARVTGLEQRLNAVESGHR